MSVKFDLFSTETKGTGIAVKDVRLAVSKALDQAHRALGVKKAFNGVARPEQADSFLGGIILGALTGGAFGAGLDEAFDLPQDIGGIEGGFLSAAFEAATELGDGTKARRRVLNDYPEGRRADIFGNRQKVKNGFNLVSGNDNNRFDDEPEAEIAVMTDMLQRLDAIERKGIKHLRLDPRGTVYETLYQPRYCA